MVKLRKTPRPIEAKATYVTRSKLKAEWLVTFSRDDRYLIFCDVEKPTGFSPLITAVTRDVASDAIQYKLRRLAIEAVVAEYDNGFIPINGYTK